MSTATRMNLDIGTRKILTAATQIASLFDPENPEIRPEFVMIAICIFRDGACAWLYDYVAAEVPEFKMSLLLSVADLYDTRLSSIVHNLRKVSFEECELGKLDDHVERVIANAKEDWEKCSPKDKEPIPIDYFLGAFLLYDNEFEILDLALHDCDFTRGEMFAYLMAASPYIDGKYPRVQDMDFDCPEEADEFMERMAVARPEATITKPARRPTNEVENHLRRTIVGQDTAVNTVVCALKAKEAGLKDPTRPIAIMLFAGYTGVGKTELAEQLAVAMGVPVKRLDMSEYVQDHETARLYGAPPGYIGYQEGGQLTDFVIKNPTSVVVFDEIERAHPKVMNILLQISEKGELTDGRGRIAKFGETFIILTSNVGAEGAEKRLVGFGSDALRDKKPIFIQAIEKLFRPEFRGRLSATIIFERLSEEDVLKVVELELKKVHARLWSQRQLRLSASSAVQKAIAASSNTAQYGARDIRNTIDRDISVSLAEYILNNEIEPESTIRVSYQEEEGYRLSHETS